MSVSKDDIAGHICEWQAENNTAAVFQETAAKEDCSYFCVFLARTMWLLAEFASSTLFSVFHRLEYPAVISDPCGSSFFLTIEAVEA